MREDGPSVRLAPFFSLPSLWASNAMVSTRGFLCTDGVANLGVFSDDSEICNRLLGIVEVLWWRAYDCVSSVRWAGFKII